MGFDVPITHLPNFAPETPTSKEAVGEVVDGWGYWSLNLPVQECEGATVRLEVAGHAGGGGGGGLAGL